MALVCGSVACEKAGAATSLAAACNTSVANGTVSFSIGGVAASSNFTCPSPESPANVTVVLHTNSVSGFGHACDIAWVGLRGIGGRAGCTEYLAVA